MQTVKGGGAAAVKPAAAPPQVTLTIDAPTGAFIRKGPGTKWPQVDSRPDKAKVNVDVYCRGGVAQGHLGPKHKSNIWYRLVGHDRWISHVVMQGSLTKLDPFVRTQHTNCKPAAPPK
jgi:hypothetical protein